MNIKLDENVDLRIISRLQVAGLEQADVVGKLWVIQNNRIQEYQPIESEEEEDE